jgi:hypothetical protein
MIISYFFAIFLEVASALAEPSLTALAVVKYYPLYVKRGEILLFRRFSFLGLHPILLYTALSGLAYLVMNNQP